MEMKEGRKRVIISGVSPEMDGGLFPIKRTVGEKVAVEADIFTDGHDLLSCVVLFRKERDRDWEAVPMEPLVNDRWRGSFRVSDMGRYRYTLKAWVDRFRTWRRDLQKRVDAGQDVSVDLQVGVQLIEQAVPRAKGAVAKDLKQRVAQIAGAQDPENKILLALDDDLAELVSLHSERRFVTTYEKEL
jgi:starch synthase (maltosyl-transferring)